MYILGEETMQDLTRDIRYACQCAQHTPSLHLIVIIVVVVVVVVVH